MATTSATIFPVYERFQSGAAAAAKAPADKFPLFLGRVAAGVEKQAASPFDETEAAQLEAVLGLSAPEVALVTQFSMYVFERAALFALKAPQLLAALADTGLPEAVCTQFATVWAEQSTSILAALRASSATMGAPLVLEDSSWRLSLGLGSSAATHVKETTAAIDLRLRRVGAAAAAPAAAAAATSPTAAVASSSSSSTVLSMEFTREELLDLLAKLDTIQEQVDALSA